MSAVVHRIGRSAAAPVEAAQPQAPPAVADTGTLIAQAHSLAEAGHLPWLVSLGAALTTGATSWVATGRDVLWLWLGLMVLVSGLAALHLRRQAGRVVWSEPAAAAWLRRHAAVCGALGAGWGALPGFALGAGAPPGWDFVVAAVIFVIGCVGAYANAASRPATLAWVLPSMLPLVAIGAGVGPAAPLHPAVAPLGLTFTLVALFFASRHRQVLARGWRTRRANDALVHELRQQVALVEQADREKSRFLGAASHDLRQPMHAIGLFAGSLQRELAGTRHEPSVANMIRAIEALETSFATMLDVSKLDAGVVEPNLHAFPIRDLFRRLHMHCAGQAEERGLSLRFRPGGRIVTSDPQLLERVLSNLIHNAIRYTADGGVVVVTRQRQGRISIEVWDTGIGIAPAELPRVFDEFYQVHNPGRDRSRGLGMGLAIVKRLVLLLGHELEVTSWPGRGTVFRILLKPTDLGELDTVVVAADTRPPVTETTRTVLVLDDEQGVRAGMQELLRTWGCQVLLAATTDEACREVLRHAGVIDVLLCDLRLAGGEDGLQAVERVRAVYGAPLPAVLITGDTSPAEVRRAHESGYAVLFKPVRPRDLFAAMRSL
jgi:signal transduction histidine kinase